MVMTQMKGITCCGDCGYYNWKKHKCTRATDEGDARDKFYADCPLPDVVLPAVAAVPVVRCSECKYRFDSIQCNMYSEGMITPDNWFCADGARRDGDA